ncbi:hypothetical protein D0Z00_000151 [Geotrichum galactomycetum]|uniref:Uncharacterized protein n=1 Tax=Geotrichum galactomycetum TaxID=27317 RepID=A0ACB6VAR2_9ASCO|nr:hypothetical protein D0Z00_000151 [Geotrichum candidum]
MLLDMPHEIVQLIAAHVDSSQVLISLAQTCSTLHSFAMPLLWADLVLDSSRICRKTSYDYHFDDGRTSSAGTTAPDSWEVFLTSAETARGMPLQYVRSLTINIPVSQDAQIQLFARLHRLVLSGLNNGALAALKKIYIMDSPLASDSGVAIDLAACAAAAPNAKITIYNTVLSRLEQFVVQQHLGARIADINISVRIAEYNHFAKVLDQMRPGLQKLTITDSPHEFSLRPINNFDASSSNTSLALAHEENKKKYAQFAAALRRLDCLTHLALPNNMDSVFGLDWLPASTTSLVCHTFFDNMWLAPTKSGALLPASEITSLQLSVPITKSIPDSGLTVPFTTLTALDLWTATCAPDFTCRLIAASRGTIKSIRLSHINADILACIAETQAASLTTLIVDDWDYIQQASVVSKLNSDKKANKTSITPVNDINEPASIDSNTNSTTTLILNAPGASDNKPRDAINSTNDDDIADEHLTPFAQALKHFLQSCTQLHTVFLTITPFSVNKSIFFSGKQRPTTGPRQMFIKYKHLSDPNMVESTMNTPATGVDPTSVAAAQNNDNDYSDDLAAVRADSRIKPVEAFPQFTSCDLLGPYLYYHQDSTLRPFLRASVFQVQCNA